MIISFLKESGDVYWSFTHNNLARNDAIRNIEQTKYQIVSESNLKNPLQEDSRLRALDNQTLMNGLRRPLATRVKNFDEILKQGADERK